MVTDPQTHTNKQTHRQDRLQYTALLSLARSVKRKPMSNGNHGAFLARKRDTVQWFGVRTDNNVDRPTNAQRVNQPQTSHLLFSLSLSLSCNLPSVVVDRGWRPQSCLPTRRGHVTSSWQRRTVCLSVCRAWQAKTAVSCTGGRRHHRGTRQRRRCGQRSRDWIYAARRRRRSSSSRRLRNLLNLKS